MSLTTFRLHDLPPSAKTSCDSSTCCSTFRNSGTHSASSVLMSRWSLQRSCLRGAYYVRVFDILAELRCIIFWFILCQIVGNLGYLLFTLPVVFGGGVLLRITKRKRHLALQCPNHIGSWHPTFIIGLSRMYLGSLNKMIISHRCMNSACLLWA